MSIALLHKRLSDSEVAAWLIEMKAEQVSSFKFPRSHHVEVQALAPPDAAAYAALSLSNSHLA